MKTVQDKEVEKTEKENMTFQEKLDYIKEVQERTDRNNRRANRMSNAAICLNAVCVLLLILANLDKIVSFARYVLSCLR